MSQSSIGGLTVRNTARLIGPDTRISLLIYAPAKHGKTTFAATLNKLTLKHHGKPTLFVAVEPGEGGGTMSIQHAGVDYVAPETYDEFLKVLAALENDTNYAGVVLDSATEYVNRFLKPYALKFPSRERIPTREAGVPERSDYQTMGEKLRLDFLRLIRLTTHPRLECRKHLVVTALQREKVDHDAIVSIHPDLPGAMALTAAAMFQTVAQIGISNRVEKEGGQTRRITHRYLITESNGVRVVGDRTGCFPDGAPLDLLEIYEQHWLPKVQENAGTAKA